ncbi:DUF4054 domain-containing protein [Campylobacter coli]|nr:DUF4054 domain-containing protein [Campylobacter coli]
MVDNGVNDNIDIDFSQLPLELNQFLAVYPEFEPVIKTQDDVDKFLVVFDKVKCLYPEFKDLSKCKDKFPFYMLVAHYLVMSGLTKSIGILPQNGLIANSSVGDVSIGYQASPYSTKGDELTYYLSLTPYGMEYLAWLARQAGLRIVN